MLRAFYGQFSRNLGKGRSLFLKCTWFCTFWMGLTHVWPWETEAMKVRGKFRVLSHSLIKDVFPSKMLSQDINIF